LVCIFRQLPFASSRISNEDFGQTLGYWGVGQGPYLVVPFLGPSNLRDGVGLLPNFYLQLQLQDDQV
jgi:ABC-type transporter lipoprotein component MlaA